MPNKSLMRLKGTVSTFREPASNQLSLGGNACSPNIWTGSTEPIHVLSQVHDRISLALASPHANASAVLRQMDADLKSYWSAIAKRLKDMAEL